jgi:GNAT superfamily N-acetyltransferase
MTATPATLIRRAVRADAAQVTRLLTGAFYDSEPIAHWLVPDGNDRRNVYTDYFAIFVDHGLRYGFIDLADDDSGALTGAALWYPHTEPVPGPAGYRDRLYAACGPWIDRFLMLDASFTEHHPPGAHHHLGYLAVHPGRQRTGIGSDLLRHHHARLDADRLPAYLEASNGDNYQLYTRHGYRTTGPVQLPDRGPLWWPMWRGPATDRQTTTAHRSI